MKKFRTRLTKSFFITSSFLLVFFALSGSTPQKSFASEVEEIKEYWIPDINEDFDDSSVLVVMNKRTGGINKQHEQSFFGDFPIEAIYDLSYINGDPKELKSLDMDNFHQILQIVLVNKSKENVINVIHQLERIDGILWAGPNHYENMAKQPDSSNGTKYSQSSDFT
ncbi:MAG: hypothetical protein FWH42_01905 [Dehalococcoidia bacterium]|nr:hypothetical protein [Dehalococcoidia bacterium]